MLTPAGPALGSRPASRGTGEGRGCRGLHCGVPAARAGLRGHSLTPSEPLSLLQPPAVRVRLGLHPWMWSERLRNPTTPAGHSTVSQRKLRLFTLSLVCQETAASCAEVGCHPPVRPGTPGRSLLALSPNLVSEGHAGWGPLARGRGRRGFVSGEAVGEPEGRGLGSPALWGRGSHRERAGR